MKRMVDSEEDAAFRTYEQHYRDAVSEFLALADREFALRELVEYLIQHRETIRDAELERLESKAGELLQSLRDTKRCQVVAELDCFRDVLALQKRLLESDERR